MSKTLNRFYLEIFNYFWKINHDLLFSKQKSKDIMVSISSQFYPASSNITLLALM